MSYVIYISCFIDKAQRKDFAHNYKSLLTLKDFNSLTTLTI